MTSVVFGVADAEMDLSNRHECPVPGCPSTAEAHHLRDTAHRMEIAELKAKLRGPESVEDWVSRFMEWATAVDDTLLSFDGAKVPERLERLLIRAFLPPQPLYDWAGVLPDEDFLGDLEEPEFDVVKRHG